MPENARRSEAALFDQFEDDNLVVADWGGDDLFTRMPRPRAVDDAPPPRFRPKPVLSDPVSPREVERRLKLVEPPVVDDEASPGAEERMRARAGRLGLSVVENDYEPDVVAHRWDESGTLIEPPPAGRRTKVITGHPGGSARPLPMVPAARRRPARTPAEWVGPQPERIVAWAFALGLVLIVIAILTAGS